jgi:tRNA(Ile)-lysidine synthase TilS/MesJ
MSGGKDSALLAKCFQELKKHGKDNFEVVYIAMDPGYAEENRNKLITNCEKLDIPVQLFDSDIFKVVEKTNEGSPCYLCARMRRGYLYKAAQDRGCNKIALGHHFDDVIETILMGVLYSGQFNTMLPKLKSRNFPGMELIRPLYLTREADIIRWVNHNGLDFLRCACGVTANCSDGGSKRQEVKRLLSELRKKDKKIDMNIFRSAEGVNLHNVISYKDNEGKLHYFEGFDEE